MIIMSMSLSLFNRNFPRKSGLTGSLFDPAAVPVPEVKLCWCISESDFFDGPGIVITTQPSVLRQ